MEKHAKHLVIRLIFKMIALNTTLYEIFFPQLLQYSPATKVC